MKLRSAVIGSAAVALLAAGTASAASAPISLTTTAPREAGLHAIDWTRGFSLLGTVPSRRGGVRVRLQAITFPFTRGFQTVATQMTGPGGTYRFVTKLRVATRYEVVQAGAPTTTSSTLIVYALEHSVSFDCNLCGTSSRSRNGTATQIYTVPAALGAEHARRPVYTYFGIVAGTRPPSRLHRIGRTTQKQIAPGRIRFSFDFAVKPPGIGSFRWDVDACYQDRFTADGFGLPGHHGCGDTTITIGRGTYLG